MILWHPHNRKTLYHHYHSRNCVVCILGKSGQTANPTIVKVDPVLYYARMVCAHVYYYNCEHGKKKLIKLVLRYAIFGDNHYLRMISFLASRPVLKNFLNMEVFPTSVIHNIMYAHVLISCSLIVLQLTCISDYNYFKMMGTLGSFCCFYGQSLQNNIRLHVCASACCLYCGNIIWFGLLSWSIIPWQLEYSIHSSCLHTCA